MRLIVLAGSLALTLVGCDILDKESSKTNEVSDVTLNPQIDEFELSKRTLFIRGGDLVEVLHNPSAFAITDYDNYTTISGTITNDLRSGGRTDGISYTISEEEELVYSNKLVEVSFFATSTGGDLVAAYSTGDVGNSGWVTFSPTEELAEFSFTYAVPELVMGNGDHIGFYPLGGPIDVYAITVNIIE